MQFELSLAQKVFIVQSFYRHNESLDNVINKVVEKYKVELSLEANLRLLRKIINAFETSGSVAKPFHLLLPTEDEQEDVGDDTLSIINASEVEEIHGEVIEEDVGDNVDYVTMDDDGVEHDPEPVNVQVERQPVKRRKVIFACGKCPKAFKNDEDLKIHFSIHTAAEKIKEELTMCDVCGATGLNKRACANHKLVRNIGILNN